MEDERNEILKRYYTALREYHYERNGIFNSLLFLNTMFDLIRKEYMKEDKNEE